MRKSIGAALVAGVVACSTHDDPELGSVSQAVLTPADAAAVLGAEDASRWHADQGPAPTTSTLHTQGASAIAVTPPYYTRYYSDQFPTTGAITAVELDLFMEPQASQWKGNLELEMMCPSRGVFWQWVGQTQLTGKPEQEWFEVSLPLSEQLQSEFFGTECDSLELRLIVNPGMGGTTFRFDNVRLVGLPLDAPCAIDADCDSGVCDAGACTASAVPSFAIRWGSAYNQLSTDIAETADGGVVVVGYQGDGLSQASVNSYLTKVDRSGTIVWTSDLGAVRHARSVARLPSGGFVVVGEVIPQPYGAYIPWLVTTDAAGNVLTSQTVSGFDVGSVLWEVAANADGSYTVGVYDGGRPVVAKLDASGSLIWSRRVLDDQLGGLIDAMAPTADGGAILTGIQGDTGRPFVSRVSGSGALEWTRAPAEALGWYYGVEETDDGGVIIAGHLSWGEQGFLIKLDPAGDEIFNASIPFYVKSVAETADGYSLLGFAGQGTAYPALALTDLGGNQLWSRVYPEAFALDHAIMWGGLRTSDGGWAEFGWCQADDSYTPYDACLFKADPQGNF